MLSGHKTVAVEVAVGIFAVVIALGSVVNIALAILLIHRD